MGVLGHFLVADEFSLDLDLMWHSLAGFSELEFSLDFDLEFFLKKLLAEDKKLVTFKTKRFWTFVFSFEFEAAVGLSLSIWSILHGLTKSLKRFGRFWQSLGGFVGGITRSTTDVHAAIRLRNLEKVLDGGWVLGLVKDLLHGAELLW